MGRLRTALVWVAAASIAACATMEKAESPEEQAAVERASAPISITDVPLTEELLYRILAAELAAQRGEYSAAVESYTELAREVPDARIAARATRLAVYAREDEKALESALLWAKYDPTSLDAQRASAALLIQFGRTSEALGYLEAVLSAYADRRDHGFMLVANMLNRGEDTRSAFDVMRAIVATREDDPFAQYAYSNIAMRAGDFDTALVAIERALDIEPGWTNAMVLRAHILREQGHLDEALSYLQEKVKALPKAADVRMAYARTLVAAEDYDAGFQQLELLSKQNPEDDEVLYSVAVLAIELERYDTAEKYLNRLIELDKRTDEAYFHLGRVHEGREEFDQAIDVYSLVGSGEFYLPAQIRIAVVLARTGELDAARNHLHVLMIENPLEKKRLYLAEGGILSDAKRYDEAFDVYDSALADYPDDRNLLYLRAMTAERLDRLDVTEHDLLQLIAQDPDNADLLNDLGYTLADRTARYDDAYAYIKRALELKPDSHFILDSMGWVMYRLGKYEDALKYLNQALDTAGKLEPEIAAHLGEVLWVTGDQAAATDLWRRALEASPDNAALLEAIERFGAQW